MPGWLLSRLQLRWPLLLLLACINYGPAVAQDSLRIHFLYGSRPAHAFRAAEPRWFGGKLGGHVGIEFAPDSILNFVPSGKFHWIGRQTPKHSRYTVTDAAGFWRILGGSQGQLKTASISLPIDNVQRSAFEALRWRYLGETPYDYAFLGMRCAAATDEVLAQLGITRRRSYWGTIFGTFHPKVLRKRLLRMAHCHGWPVTSTEGSTRRIWQR